MRIGFRRVLSNFSWLTADKVLRLGGGLLVGIPIARQIGPAEYGVFNFATAAVGLATVVVGVGLDSIFQRDLVSTPAERWHELVGTALLVRFAAAVLTLALYSWIIVATTPDPHTQIASLIIGLMLIFTPLSVFDFWFQSQVLAKFGVIAQDVAFLASLIARIALLLTHRASAVSLAIVAVCELALAGVLLAFAYRSWAGSLRKLLIFNRQVAREWAKESWSQLLSGVAVFAYMRIDQIMLQQLAGPAAVGVYSAAVKISEIGYFIPVVLGSTLLASIVRTRDYDVQLYTKRRQRYFDLSVLLACTIAVPVSLFAHEIVPRLYGANYSDAAGILVVHAWSAVFIFLGVARGQYFVAEKLLRFSFYTTVAGALINVTLNFVLIPVYGGLGAAWATLIAYAIAAVATSFFSTAVRPIGAQQLRSLIVPGAILRLWKTRFAI